ncbi:DUF2799 domain-containing protein [Hoeflea prorocentri]|uniref:DUF2799 domain-containing protein n=1 Tax=Hoeflea prorocentri TaxID=1922333 RepID=A0A9X3ULW3_9HYPH|nr:DUF2799 domain-containing protein [Hoeflea prorocentri]MCY6381441.1 DUF2799 domain-containing protein [Hoeflea prorocentri]MDA5399241.1 DUF2799 domain-containing protein [Hoeflea prorocentri]
MRSSALKLAALMLVLPLALSACATLNEAECETTNWRDLGERNGQQGKASSFIVEHQKACSAYGLPVDGTAWRAGWEQGIRQYCTPQNGLLVGKAGKSYANACPVDLAPGFLRTYSVGKRVYDAGQERDRVRREIEELERSLSDVSDQKELVRIQSRLIIKQNDLFQAQANLRDAEREADAIAYAR